MESQPEPDLSAQSDAIPGAPEVAVERGCRQVQRIAGSAVLRPSMWGKFSESLFSTTAASSPKTARRELRMFAGYRWLFPAEVKCRSSRGAFGGQNAACEGWSGLVSASVS